MEKVIDGLLYDTESAGEVAEWSNGHEPNGAHRVDETLYRTPNGRWFVHGRGGGLSRYSESVAGGSRAGEGIRALTPNEAQQWLEDRGETEALKEWFADEISAA